MKLRVNRWAIAIAAVVIELMAFVVWRITKARQAEGDSAEALTGITI